MILAKTENDRLEALKKYQKSLKFLENELKGSKSVFFNSGDKAGMLDYMIWPWIERKDVHRKIHPQLPEPIPETEFPLLVISSLFS